MGMSLLVASLTLLIVALNLGGDAYTWDSKITIGLFVGSACSFIGFIVAENFATLPVIPMELFVSLKWRNVSIMTGEQISHLLVDCLRIKNSRPVLVILPSVRYGEIYCGIPATNLSHSKHDLR